MNEKLYRLTLIKKNLDQLITVPRPNKNQKQFSSETRVV